MNHRGKITLLLFCFSICATAALIHFHLQVRSEFQHPGALFNAVDLQLKAFRASNFPTAYSHASASFQEQWTLEQFVGMVRGDYARILKAERVEFGPWQRKGRRAILQVFFVNADGTVCPCIYTLVNEGEHWKIDGARWVKGWPTGQRMRGIRS